MLNSASPLPLYHQLADVLTEKMRTGEYAPGCKIPSEHRLAALYGIGRPTARQATDLLVRKGLLIRKRGAGTFVAKPRKEVDVLSLAGTISSFEKQGDDFTTDIICPVRLLDVQVPGPNPYYKSRAYYFRRLTTVEDQPVLLEDIYLNPALFPNLEQMNLAGRSLSRMARDKYYLIPAGGKQDFRISYPGEEQSATMGITMETPLLTVHRYIHFPQAENGIYAELYCRTDRFVFSQMLGGSAYA
jgi:GntR family transcriptional regulator